MKVKIALFAMVLWVAFTSCKKKTHCGAYDNIHVDSWFPFQKDSKLVFWDENLISPSADTFTILQVKKSEAYISEDQDLGGSKGDCNTLYEAFSKETNKDDNSKPNLYFSYKSVLKYDADYPVKSGQIKMFKNAIFDFGDVDYYTIKPSTTSSYTYTIKHLDSFITPVTLHYYRNVYEISASVNTQSNVDVDKIYIAKDSGLIAYRKAPTGQTFYKFYN